MTTDVSGYLLGATPPKVDPRTFRLVDYLEKVPGFPAPPPSTDYSQIVSWGVLGNNVKGCCVLSAHGHNLMEWCKLAGVLFTLSDAEVLQLYDYLTGGIDRGLVILDTLNWLRKNTWKGRSILGFATVDPRNHLLVKHAIAMFGSIYRGIGLPTSAQRQLGTLWDVVGTDAPGSWGWHAVMDVAYDAADQGTKCITWGMVQPATWRFWDRYCSEAYVIIPTDPIPGFNRDAFIRDLKEIGAYIGPEPSPTPTPPPSPPPSPSPEKVYVYASKVAAVISYPDGKSQSFGVGLAPARVTSKTSLFKRFLGLFG